MIRHALLVCTAMTLTSSGALGQDSASAKVGAHAIGLLTHATSTPGDRALTEAYLTQPMLSASLRSGWFRASGILNLEGATLHRGELELGAWGEGYVDRRHPHAYVHELMIGGESPAGSVAFSVVGGRGFVPFGSDDPMSRPFVSYPVDHHLAQILERLTIVGAIRAGPIALEGATFGGDEPLDPSTPPLARRFGDSWSVRGTFYPQQAAAKLVGVELAASYANVKSPEFREGGGLDQRKAHIDFRVERVDSVVSRYALLELARTTDVDRGRSLYTFDAALVEAAVCRRGLGFALRWERSDRPEEERLLDLSRAARPATDVSILGVTEWTTLAGAIGLPAARTRSLHAAPFVEAAWIMADRTSAALFDPVRFYGSNHMLRISAGLRVGVGHEHGRMGRYGVASGEPAAIPSFPPHVHVSHRMRCFS